MLRRPGSGSAHGPKKMADMEQPEVGQKRELANDEAHSAGKRIRRDEAISELQAPAAQPRASVAALPPAPVAQGVGVVGKFGFDGQAPVMLPPPPQMYTQPPPSSSWALPASEQVCKDYTNGVCSRGAACKFAHVGAPNVGLQTSGTPVCKDFSHGMCTRGAQCKFSHEVDWGEFAPGVPPAPAYGGPGLQPGPVAPPPYDAPPSSSQQVYDQYSAPPVSSSGKQLCKDYMQGRCARGQQCRFSHEGLPEVQVNQPLCKDFVNGQCARGNGCRYKHDREASWSSKVGEAAAGAGGGKGGAPRPTHYVQPHAAASAYQQAYGGYPQYSGYPGGYGPPLPAPGAGGYGQPPPAAGAGGYGYGQPPAAIYGPPPAAGYCPPPATGYGQPPAASYGPPPAPGYGPAPPAAGYGQPPAAGYGPPPYGQPPAAGYGQPPGRGYYPGYGGGYP